MADYCGSPLWGI